MAIYLKITNPTEVVKKKTSKWLTDITPERIDRKLVEDEVIKGIIEQLTLEGIANGAALGATFGPNPTGFTAKSGVIENMMAYVVLGEKTPEEAQAWGHAELQKMVDKARR